MARPRTPLAKAIATGEAQRRPGRFRSRREPKVSPLGKPSEHLDEQERAYWKAFKRELPWLMESDRCLVEITCMLRAMVEKDPEVKAIAQLRLCLSSMGATPTARTKIEVPAEDDDDPAEAYLN